uniref:Uncharacterized protein n=1 Tax=Ciona intestinalis TaxID=7719 RepID=H2XP50_CIOIN
MIQVMVILFNISYPSPHFFEEKNVSFCSYYVALQHIQSWCVRKFYKYVFMTNINIHN